MRRLAGALKRRERKSLQVGVPSCFVCCDHLITRSVDIVRTFKASLDKLEWMDHKSAVAAAEKVNTIHPAEAVTYFDILGGWT